MSDTVNIGIGPGDPDADTTFEAFEKINQKFDQVDSELENRVEKQEGKGLSTDDFQADGDYPNLRARATTKEDVDLGNVENFGVATQAQAQAGEADDKYMTPERTSDHYNKRILFGTADPANNTGDDGDLYFQYE